MARIDIDSYSGVDAFGGRDSTGGLQQAIIDGERELATDYVIGPGTYLYRPLTVRGSNLSFRARGRVQLVFQPSPQPPRGHGITLTGGPSSSAPQHDVTFEGLEMDGTLGYTGNNDYTRPDIGWDTGNKAFAQFSSPSAFFDRISLLGCYFHGWRGEVVYGGGTGLGSIKIEDCELGDTNGDAISTSATQQVRHNKLYRCAAHGIEDTYDQSEQKIIDNDIEDCDLDGIAVVTYNATEPYGPSYIEGNRLKNCKRAGIAGYGTRNAWARRNTLTDCGWKANGHGPFYFDKSNLWAGSTTRDLHVRDNDVVIDRQKLGPALIVTGPTTGPLDIEQPRVWRNAMAA